MSKNQYLPTEVQQHESVVATGPFESVQWYRKLWKPAFDVAFVILLIPVLLPLICFFAFLVSRDGFSPFYTQKRVGKNGRTFRIWKLRTMVPDADAKLEAHLAASPLARAEWDSTQKLRHDPRITPIGHFLRRTSMDELPQFFNVLLGEMSIVGPRPMMECQRDLYPGLSYYALRPGITGAWQVSDRNASSFAARARFDDQYLERVSVGTDARIIAKTLLVVFQATGC